MYPKEKDDRRTVEYLDFSRNRLMEFQKNHFSHQSIFQVGILNKVKKCPNIALFLWKEKSFASL